MHFKTQNEIFSRCGSKTNGPRRGAWNSCLMACSQDSLEVNCHKSVKLSSWFSMLSSIRWFRLRRQIPGSPCRLLPARAWPHGLPWSPRPARAAPAKVIDESSPILTTMYNDIHIPNIWRGCLLPSASSLMSRLLRVLSHLRIYEIRFYLLMKTFMDYCPNCGWRDHAMLKYLFMIIMSSLNIANTNVNVQCTSITKLENSSRRM